jgi:hypothetical protein
MSGAQIVPDPNAVPGRKAKRRPIVAKVRHLNALQSIAKAPDQDVEGWRRRLRELFATGSPCFVEASLKQLMGACKLPGEPRASTTSVSAALEIIASLEPENEAQAALAVHVACLHCASLNVMSRMPGITERNVIAMATAAAKLERAYQLALESYDRMKHGVRQVVRVERVEVQPGAQAIVGVVASPGRAAQSRG